MQVTERESVGRRLETWPAWPALLVGLFTAVGGALRLAVAGQDVFADELSTYWIVTTNGFGGVLSTVHSNAEITPPLSFLAAWLTTRIDVTPELLRASSLLAGIATIPATYLLGCRTVGRSAGLVAAALTTLAPFMVYYSAEARGYALMMALGVVSTLALLTAVDSGRARWWVVYAVASCAAVYTHYTVVFLLGAQLLWLLWTHPEARRPAIVANIAAAGAFLPWLSGLIKDFSSPTTDILTALQPFDAEHVRISLGHWSIGYPYASAAGLRDIPGRAALVLLALAVAVALVGLVMRRGDQGSERELVYTDRRTLLIVALALSVPLGAALWSAVGTTTLFSTRNLAASWPPLALSLATLLVAAGPRLRLAAVALAVASFAIGAAKLLQDEFQRPDYEAVAGFVKGNAAPGDVVIDETGVLSPGPLSHLDVVLDRPLRAFRSRAPQEHDHPFTIFDPNVTPAEATRKAIAAAEGGRIFLATDVRGAALKRPFGPYRLVETRRYPGIINLVVDVYAD
jgi:4-amino-4-deoxy-L-arabinose transferase-like glycosyltransferase